jgi:vacuolar-type H+-ATPase subunit E/Vma4
MVMETRHKIMPDEKKTKSSPFSVVLTVAFLKNNYAFFLTLAVCAIPTLILIPYMLDPRQRGWIVLSILAILFGIYGVSRSFYEISKIEIENFLTRSITEKASDYLRRGQQVELGELRDRISPFNDTEPTPAMIRLIDHVVDEARINRFDSSITLTLPYRDEAVDIIFKLQHYQKIVLWIGIGGTFIGILDAIKPERIGNLVTMSSEQFGIFLAEMFDGLSISFSASLAGLVSATVLSFFLLLVKKKQEVYFKNMESVVTLVLTAARKSKNSDSYLNEVEALRDDVQKSQAVTRDLQHAVCEMQKQIILQNGQVQESVNNFFASNERINKIIDKTEEELRVIRDSAELKSTVQQGIKDAAQQLAASIAAPLTILSGQMDRFRQSADLLGENVVKHSEQTRSLNTSVTSRIAELGNTIRSIRFHQGFFSRLLDRILN